MQVTLPPHYVLLQHTRSTYIELLCPKLHTCRRKECGRTSSTALAPLTLLLLLLCCLLLSAFLLCCACVRPCCHHLCCKHSQSVKDMPMLQDMPPVGGFPSIRIQRRLPSTGPTGAAIFAVGGAVMAYGYYNVSKSQRFDQQACRKRQLQPAAAQHHALSCLAGKGAQEATRKRYGHGMPAVSRCPVWPERRCCCRPRLSPPCSTPAAEFWGNRMFRWLFPTSYVRG